MLREIEVHAEEDVVVRQCADRDGMPIGVMPSRNGALPSLEPGSKPCSCLHVALVGDRLADLSGPAMPADGLPVAEREDLGHPTLRAEPGVPHLPLQVCQRNDVFRRSRQVRGCDPIAPSIADDHDSSRGSAIVLSYMPQYMRRSHHEERRRSYGAKSHHPSGR